MGNTWFAVVLRISLQFTWLTLEAYLTCPDQHPGLNLRQQTEHEKTLATSVCQLWDQQAALSQDCCDIMVTIGLLLLDTYKLVPVVSSVLAAVQYWMQSARRGVPSWS